MTNVNTIFDRIRDSIYDETILLLKELGYRWFLGGSRRFGYHHNLSDYDLFIYIGEDFDDETIEYRQYDANNYLFEKINKLIEQFNTMIKYDGDTSEAKLYGSDIIRQYTIPNILHLNFIGTEEGFNNFKTENDLVDYLLNDDYDIDDEKEEVEYKVLQNVVESLKEKGINKSHLFRVLVEIAENKKRKDEKKNNKEKK